ncbi:MAG: hypothetical protein CMQ32_06560, partial [Gammaproteobacteria bacterium]|nr:hypothetical protein [Gammaproteobacteria bacterium]
PSKLVGVAGDHMNYLFYEQDPGRTIPDVRNYQYQPRTDGVSLNFTGLILISTTSIPVRET